MSKLNVNIPITFEAGAALNIKDDITSQVQSADSHLTTFNQNAEGFNLFTSYLSENKSGLVINNKQIILSATTTYIQSGSGSPQTLFTNGKITTDFIQADEVEAKTLKTVNGTGEVDIRSGVITCSGQNKETQIQFGVDDGGNAILNFIRNNSIIYSLGPGGLLRLNFDQIDNSASTIAYKNMQSVQDVNDIIVQNTNHNNAIFIPMMKCVNYSSGVRINDAAIGMASSLEYSKPVKYTRLNEIRQYLVCIPVSALKRGTTYYKFTAGYKFVQLENNEKMIAYLDKLAIGATGTEASVAPAYDGKTYKAETCVTSVDYASNSANYIDDGYYFSVDINETLLADDSSVPSFYKTYYDCYIRDAGGGSGSGTIRLLDQKCFCVKIGSQNYCILENTNQIIEITIKQYGSDGDADKSGKCIYTWKVYGLMGFTGLDDDAHSAVDASTNCNSTIGTDNYYIILMNSDGTFVTDSTLVGNPTVANMKTFLKDTYLAWTNYQYIASDEQVIDTPILDGPIG